MSLWDDAQVPESPGSSGPAVGARRTCSAALRAGRRQSDNLEEVWGFVWGLLFGLIGMLGMVIFTEGNTRRYILQGAFVGWIAGMAALFIVFAFVAQY